MNWNGAEMKVWQCIVCGYIYDEAVGEPKDGILKADFEMVEI